ncbi:MAG: hypothetical protein KKA99_01495 [Gammaproteobacteria bacterium]|nr:hypothetical protein [Gammaproteobacteria bacterium]MBU1615880.1 hypothetical protein [bacterium]
MKVELVDIILFTPLEKAHPIRNELLTGLEKSSLTGFNPDNLRPSDTSHRNPLLLFQAGEYGRAVEQKLKKKDK